ncbi:bromodomain adjacent to zinc finger domain protein 1A [Leguminivora glycinivorella]|uniref:bromodomain adjacent to zinc finger domain protein 1A n=1 Tax=Leguminivora glycinivorella TaxID=1035111 RepID=UPI00201082DD|nr:bromodomain adjacent to zinc finger domain protein 1A [Leguminivora glycinivorella]
MPLLKRKAFEKSTASGYLRDDDEVFHCEITDEIFKDYEEYCERIILVNSMVWSCEMTGKNNLTYAEALESEKNARKSLRDFPMELRIPILYLASKTKKSSFAEMSEDVFNYVRERFFVGETVEACLEGDSWQEAHILSITAQKQPPGSKVVLPGSSYCYEVEQYQEDNPAGGKIGLAPHDRVRRRKGVYSRDKNRLFLKQFVEQSQGIIVIKKSALEKYNISKVNFEQIFIGTPPEFSPSKKLLKSPPSKAAPKPGSATKLKGKKTPDKKGQQSMDKFLKKTDKNESPKPKTPSDPNAKKNAQELAAKMRRAEEEMRQRKEEEKAKKKAYLKEWQKVKEDQELEDHKIIPKGTPIDMDGIPHEHFGDFLSVLEFVHIHGETLKVKDTLHNGLDVETFRKALTLKQHAGVFSDLLQMLLSAIFQLQEDEAEDYNESGGIHESTARPPALSTGMNKAVDLATKASKWSQTYLGTPLSKLQLDPTTVTEVLRLHLLSSGAAPGSRCATWRYTQRGGYSSHDDAGLQLRLQHPELLRTLLTKHVADMSLGDKFLILQCLMNQIISYGTVRDVIEEKLDEMRNTKQALRSLHINERRREAQLLASRQELKKEYAAKKAEEKLTGEAAKAHDEALKAALEKMNKESEGLKAEYEKKVKELKVQLFDYTSYVGSDRAYRRYWLNQHVAGLFVENGAESRGPCRDKMADLHRERAGSDKENESAANSRGGSPKKPLTNINGLSNKLSGLEASLAQAQELMLCTGDPPTCNVHGKDENRPFWWVYHTPEQIEGLIQSLNKRGLRENDLRQNLELDKDNILEYIQKCPLHLLNPAAKPPPPVPSTRMHKFQPSLNVPDDCTLSEALELSLRDHILELEEKIFHGCLGVLKVKDREAWRGTIMVRGYDKQADYLSWGPERRYRDDYHMPGGVTAVPTDNKTDITAIPENKYRDPGHCLEPRPNGIKVEPGAAATALQTTVRGLASALLQVEQAIHHKYIKRPLGLSDKERKEREAKNKPLDNDTLERWEVSLMECRSFAQIVLHLFTLDSSITWSASILNASCRLCRRKTDPDNMLLCDGCNKGHHLYCLKPKLTKVPDGDWFCEQCRPKERTPRKRRKIIEEPINDDSESNSSESEGELDLGLCGACGSGGELAATCRACSARYHAECVAAPPSRQAKRWICRACQAPPSAHANNSRHREPSSRRCAAAALDNIHHYTRNLHSRRSSEDSYDSEDNTSLISLKKTRSRQSKEASPLVNGHTPTNNRRSRKSKDDVNTSASKKAKTPLTNGVHEEKQVNGRKRGSKESSLHTEGLEQLLKEVLKHKDCWPFYDPVDTEMVPDYLDVIKTPMDFTTIKEKLSRGEYESDAALLDDAALVFHNCYTYNKDSHPVAKAGVRLEQYIQRRCAELSLPPLPELSLEAAAPPPVSGNKKPRLK